MAENRSLSSSEQYIKKSNRRLVFAGLGLFLLVFFIWMFTASEQQHVIPQQPRDFTSDDFIGYNDPSKTADTLSSGKGRLVSNPAQVDMNNVVLGSKAEALIVLTAENAPILFQGYELAETQQDGFTIESGCTAGRRIEKGASCNVKVLWNPVELRQIQNILNIRWRLDDGATYGEDTTSIRISAQSTDSKDCVICETVAEDAKKKPRMGMMLNGQLAEIDDDGNISLGGKNYRVDANGNLLDENGNPTGMKLIDGKLYDANGNLIGTVGADGYIRDANGNIIGRINPDGSVTLFGQKGRVTENGIIVDENGNIIGVAEPERIPLDMNSKIIGTISKTQDVIDTNGETVGRLLGDGTIVSPSLEIIGAAIPVLSVMDDYGNVIGKLTMDGAVVDASNSAIGRPMVDGTIVDLGGTPIGTLRPWGLVSDFMGHVIGAVLPDGNVMGQSNSNIARISPTGIAIDATGELVGGVIPQGAAVGAGCASLGKALQNGVVKDAFDQTIGRVLPDGAIVDDNYNEVGSVITQGLIINEKGTVLGFVNSEGKAVDSKGTVIGCVNPDGTVSAGKKFIGAIMKKGRVIGHGCTVLGSVYPNGSVVSQTSGVVGKVLADRYVINSDNRIVGVVIPRGTAIAEGCRLLGLISLNGRVLDTTSTDIGCVTMEGDVVNNENKVIGAVNKRGIVVDKNGNVIGRTRMDGKVFNKDGKVIGCVNPDGTVTDLDGNIIGTVIPTGDSAFGAGTGGSSAIGGGVILDANGNPTDWTIVGNEVFDKNGNKIGTLNEKGWIVDENGNIVGFIPPDGVIFSPEGAVLGRYSRSTGVAVNMAGERFAKILPDYTAISGDKNEIVGALIADKTTFVTQDGTILGTLRVDGSLTDDAGNVMGAIRADGSVVDKDGNVIGSKVLKGTVFSATGDIVGSVNDKAEVLSAAKTVIGKIYGNGLAVSNNGAVLGAVMSDMTLAIGAEGYIGTVSVNGDVADKNGRSIGKVSPFGLVLGANGELLGKTLRVGPYVDMTGRVIGWTSFNGELNDTTGRPAGQILMNGTALNKNAQVIGTLVPRGITVNTKGLFAGTIAPNARVMGAKNAVVGSVKASPYFYDVEQKIAGQHLNAGVALDVNGNLIGWTRYDGTVVNADRPVGLVALDGYIYAQNGTIIGFYVPFGTPAINDSGKSFGFMGLNGLVINAGGEVLGKAISPTSVVQNGKLVGRLLKDTNSVTNFHGTVIGQVSPNGTVTNIQDAKPFGSVSMNGFAMNLTKQVVGGLTLMGTPLSEALTIIGQEFWDGTVLNDGKSIGKVGATQIVFDLSNRIIGFAGLSSPFIGRDGNVISTAEGTSAITNATGATIANQMPFGSALTAETLWAGGSMPTGTVVTDDGFDIGVVAADGAILNAQEITGRILPDGTAAGIVERMTYTTMPYVGAVVRQGVPVHFKGMVLGRTTTDGGVLDATDKRTNKILDDGTILGTTDPLDGIVVPFGSANNHNGDTLGMLSGDGMVVTVGGTVKGKIATNGTVKGNHVLKIEGAMVPQGLATNGCRVIGQTTPAGQLVDGRGSIVGHISIDKKAMNKSGETIGQITPIGSVLSTDGSFIGRSMSDATVVDTRGNNVGCVNADASVVDNTGAVLGCVLQRGPIISKDGLMIGRSKFDGTIMSASNAVIGKVGGDCKVAYDMDGNVIGRVVSPDEELIYNDDGTIAGTFNRGGEYRDPAGNHIFTVKPNGDIIDPKTGKVIARLGEDGVLRTPDGKPIDDATFLKGYQGVYDADGNLLYYITPDGKIIDPKTGEIIGYIKDGVAYDKNGNPLFRVNPDGTVTDMNGNVIGYIKDGDLFGTVSGCDILNLDGTKIASIMADGSIIDLNGEVYATVLGDGTLLNKNNVPFGSIAGTNIRLDRCGIKSGAGLGAGGMGSGATGRRIFIGNKAFGITSNGSLVAEDGTVVGYMGQDGRPYSLDNRLLTGVDGTGRTRPNTSPKMTVSPEQLEQMQQLLAQKRQGMRGGIKNAIRPEGRLLAKARKKQDKDWGLPRIVSSWPVKMTNMILKDKAIPAVLVRSIDSRFKDVPATAIVERHIYSEEGRNIIIPAGSRLIGKLSGSPGTNHVAKMELSWERLIRPDGGAFSFQGTSGDAQGRGGVAAYLDEQLLAKYGKPILSSVVTSAISYMVASDDPISTTEGGTVTQSDRSKAADDARESFTDNMDQIFQQLIDEATQTPPVVFVPAGTRITVFSNEDLWLRSEDDDEQEYEEQFGADSKDAKGVGTTNWVDKRGTTAEQIASGGTMGNAAEDVYYDPEMDGYTDGHSNDYSGGGYATFDQAAYEDALNASRGALYTPEDGVIDQQQFMSGVQQIENNTPAQTDLTNRISRPVLPKTKKSANMF